MARRRTAGRHSRRIRRITPRRWLPFVVLLGVVVAAVVVARQDPGPDPVRDRAVAAATRLPVAAQADALSTAWYCSGGTATGEGGLAELSVVIASAEDRGLTAEVTAVDAEGTSEQTTVEVPANGRVRVVGHDLLTADWVAMTVEVLGGRATVEREVQGPLDVDLSPCATNAAASWYVPSGSTIRGATDTIVLYNPFPDDTSVDISFATDQGTTSPNALKGFSVPGRSVRIVPQDALPARRPEVATRVEARRGRLVVDRVQVYDGTGDPAAGAGDDAVTTPAPIGIASTGAIPSVAPRWLFPDAVVADDVRVQVAVYNPTAEEARVDVVLAYEDPERQGDVEPLQITVPARQQELVDLTDLGVLTPGVPFTIDVRSIDGVGLVAEQLVFGAPAVTPETAEPAAGEEAPPDEPAEEEGDEEGAAEEAEVPPPVEGFAVVPGSPVGATDWFLASRGTSSLRQATVVVANPGAAAVEVQVTELVAGRRTVVEGATVTVPAGDRRILDLGTAEAASALLVTADEPIVVAHTVVSLRTRGLAEALATPFPESVTLLPPAD